ncbi:MAG: hypothetical protein J0L72_10490 [Armatimonadetes bacterium]|nr:hypothetical protein [Armatimonadota bacterium]
MERSVGTLALAVCGGMALFAVAGPVGALAGATLKAGLGLTIPAAVLGSLSGAVSDAAQDAIKSFADGHLQDALADYRQTNREKINHDLSAAIAVGLHATCRSVLEKSPGLSDSAKEVLRHASGFFGRAGRERRADELTRFANALDQVISSRLGGVNSQDDFTTHSRAITGLLLSSDGLEDILEHVVCIAINLPNLAANVSESEQIIKLLREESRREIGRASASYLARNSVAFNKYLFYVEQMQHAEILEVKSGVSDLVANARLQAALMAQSNKLQTDILNLLKQSTTETHAKLEYIVGTVDHIQSTLIAQREQLSELDAKISEMHQEMRIDLKELNRAMNEVLQYLRPPQ